MHLPRPSNAYHYVHLAPVKSRVAQLVSSCIKESSRLNQYGGTYDETNGRYEEGHPHAKQNEDKVNILLSVRYEFVVTPDVIDRTERKYTVDVSWSFEDNKKFDCILFNLKKDLAKMLHRKLTLVDMNSTSTAMITNVIGYTKAVMTSKSSIEKGSALYANLCFLGKK